MRLQPACLVLDLTIDVLTNWRLYADKVKKELQTMVGSCGKQAKGGGKKKKSKPPPPPPQEDEEVQLHDDDDL